MLLVYLKLPDNKVLTALRAFVNVLYAVLCLVVVELAAYLVLLASDGIAHCAALAVTVEFVCFDCSHDI